jgi:hypothetical protein
MRASVSHGARQPVDEEPRPGYATTAGSTRMMA